MKADSELIRLRLSDEQRVDDLPAMLIELADLLESQNLDGQPLGRSTISGSAMSVDST
jgi:hypothetical protein